MSKKNNIGNSIIIIILGLEWMVKGIFTNQSNTFQIIFIIGAIIMLIKGVLVFINVKKRKNGEITDE